MNPSPTNYSEIFKNLKLSMYNKLRYYLQITTPGEFTIPEDYELSFYDDFKAKNLSMWEEASGWWEQPYHPGNLRQWFDPAQVRVGPEGLELHSVVKSRDFPGITIPNAIGMIQTKQAWSSGIFKFVAKLPKGKFLWPALWLSGVESWPPEIDLLEGYSDNTLDYSGGKILQSNVHFKYGVVQAHIGGSNHYLPNKVTEEFIEYIIWLEKDFIRMYYNGYLVKEITNAGVLAGMTGTQKLVLNNATQAGFCSDNITPLIIKEISVYQK